jgi:hypothetical protein
VFGLHFLRYFASSYGHPDAYVYCVCVTCYMICVHIFQTAISSCGALAAWSSCIPGMWILELMGHELESFRSWYV